jgi:hypothetical protein
MNLECCAMIITELVLTRPVDIPFADCIDNTDIFTKNRCGITHGLFDVGWNLAGVGDAVRYSVLNFDRNLHDLVFRSTANSSLLTSSAPALISVHSTIKLDENWENPTTVICCESTTESTNAMKI